MSILGTSRYLPAAIPLGLDDDRISTYRCILELSFDCGHVLVEGRVVVDRVARVPRLRFDQFLVPVDQLFLREFFLSSLRDKLRSPIGYLLRVGDLCVASLAIGLGGLQHPQETLLSSRVVPLEPPARMER